MEGGEQCLVDVVVAYMAIELKTNSHSLHLNPTQWPIRLQIDSTVS